MNEPNEGTLFEAAKDVVVDGPLLFVTNRYNLLEFLSAGYVLPLSGIPKYYADLLAYSPGRIPLLRGPVSDSVCADVSREDPTAFPVALEVDPRLTASISAPLLRNDGSASSGSLDESVVAAAPAGLLPLAAVTKVHFRSQDELEEHSAREYENVRTDNLDLVVSPGVFGGGGVAVESVKTFLEGLEAVNTTTADFLDSIDRLNGARTMLAAASPPRVEALRALGTLLDGKVPDEEQIPAWIHAALIEEQPKAVTAGHRLFAAAADVLRKEDRAAAWKPLEVLSRVEEKLASTKMSKKNEAEISKNLRPIGAILRNERDFKPFEKDSGLPAAKALLLALLRPDPDRLMSWDRAETGADDGVMLGAGVLVGLLRGHKKLPLEWRTPVLDQLLGEQAVTAVARIVPDALRSLSSGGNLIAEERATQDGGALVQLLWGEQVVIEKTRGAPSAAERLLGSDLSDPANRDIAIYICRAQGWADCVSTTMAASSGTFALDVRDKSISITVPGLVDVVHSLNEVGFRTRLVAESLPPALEADVRRQLEDLRLGAPAHLITHEDADLIHPLPLAVQVEKGTDVEVARGHINP